MKYHSTYNTRSFLMGVLVTLLVISLATPALAAAGKMIEVFGGIKIYIDDVELNPKDAAGNPVVIEEGHRRPLRVAIGVHVGEAGGVDGGNGDDMSPAYGYERHGRQRVF